MMPRFNVRVTRKIEFTAYVQARDAQEAKAVTWAKLPEHVEDWHCDVFDGTKYKIEQVEE